MEISYIEEIKKATKFAYISLLTQLSGNFHKFGAVQ